MSDKTAIEWTKRCSECGDAKALSAFTRDRSRHDGLTYRCRECRNASARRVYQPKPRPVPGRRFVPPRDGDRQQARRRIDHLINVGLLPGPNDVPCTDCGHLWSEGERRHEYDHYLGYDAACHESVEAVCTICHHAREDARRAA